MGFEKKFDREKVGLERFDREIVGLSSIKRFDREKVGACKSARRSVHSSQCYDINRSPFRDQKLYHPKTQNRVQTKSSTPSKPCLIELVCFHVVMISIVAWLIVHASSDR